MTCASDALNQIVAAVQQVYVDTPWGDELAKEALAAASLAIESMRRAIEAPVMAVDRPECKSASTIPASEAA